MNLNRRQFLGAASAAAFPFIFPAYAGLNVRKYAANEKVNVGVIGIGRISTTMDIPLAIKFTNLCRFTAVCDLDSKRLKHGVDFIQKQYRKLKKEKNAPVKAFADYHDLLDDPSIDAVEICLPDHWHALVACAALAKGKHIWLQKPFAQTIIEGRIIANLAKIQNRVAPDGKGVYTENKPKHHPWQHGLYVGLHAVNGENFWEKENDRFHPEPVARPVVDGNKASWKVKTRWTKPDGAPVLTETQEWTLTDHGTNYVMDVTWTLAADYGDVTFGKWAYGGLFLRMPYKKANAKRQFAVNSRGQRNGAAEQKEAEWVEVSMPIEGREQNGTIRFEDLPGNPGYPNPWRVDGQLGIAPSHCIRGPWRLSKGEKRVNRYRLTVK